ncbi:MAG: ABC transporter ATP-binding protein [Desulfovibrio sp.]|jgi:ABC-type lipoprotein export system ATPase subunit|nr:ABC transporter ATP-binding protein [Desulfovibrio sp.]
MSVIFTKDLHKGYAGFEPVLRGVDMEAEAGEMVAVMGPSGCGKSTMLHIFGMLHTPDSGRLEILGTDVFTLNRERAAAFRRVNMGFVMQSANLFDHSTVFENVEFPLIYEGIPPQERWGRVIRALDLVRLSARVHYRSNRLSGGEQQRAAIARAMVNNPRILLADEPTGALDARTSRHIMENFRELCHGGGVCLIMVTHDPKMAEYCDTIYTLEDGLLHCRKRNIAPLAAAAPQAEATRGGVFVTECFTGEPASASAATARLFHAGDLLTRVYDLRGGLFQDISDDYALPLAVRSAGLSRFTAIFSALRRQKTPAFAAARQTLTRAFQGKFPLARLLALAGGGLLARWALEDRVEFFIGGPGYFSAAATRAAACLAGLPFALIVDGADVADDRLAALAEEACCLCCAADSRDVWLKRLADMPGMTEERLLFLPEPPEPSAAGLPPPEERERAEQGDSDGEDRGDDGHSLQSPEQREFLTRLRALLAGNAECRNAL